MANLVYPGANHTRFDHSLGVYHIASLMADILLPGEEFREKRNIIRYSALLHDVGHGPFSHVSEAVLNKFFKSEHEEKIHEQITQRLIESDSELKNILSPSEIGMVIGLLNGNIVDYFIMKEIVSGPLDADKMDYIKTKDDTVAEFQDESMVFNSISESLNEVYFEVYAPVEFETALEKEKKLNEFKIKIMEILEELKDQEG
jgi:hypothetical protein